MNNEKLTHYEWLGRLAQDDACIMPNETLKKMRDAISIGTAAEMDDFIRAVRAGSMPRTDEPYATVASHIRALIGAANGNSVSGNQEIDGSTEGRAPQQSRRRARLRS